MSSKHAFVVIKYKQSVPADLRPAFSLSRDSWDDYGNKIQFHLSYVDHAGSVTWFGPVKVLQRTSKSSEPIALAETTRLPANFTELGDEFVSLGQDDDYYKRLHKLFGERVGEVL